MNLERSFTSSSTEKSDIRELIQELFYLQNLFKNFNNLNYVILQDKSKNTNATSKILREIHKIPLPNKIFVNEVLTGFWNENNPNFFVLIHRRILENKKLNINDWIDLIFGIYSYGEKAREKMNLFMPYCYDNVVSCRLSNIEKGMQLSYLKLFELGVNPKQVFFTPLENRKKINECNNYVEIKILLNNKNNYNVKYFSFNQKFFEIKDEMIYENEINNFQINKILYNVNNIFKEKKETFLSKITSFSIYKASLVKSFYILGLEDGITLIYIKFEELKIYNLYKILTNHSKRINFINSNDNLNMFIDCSNDDYIHLYTLPNVKLIHSIKIPNVKFVLLTSSPLPGFITITNKNIFMFNINGELVYKIENKMQIIQPIIIHDEEFNDYLVYNLNEIIKLPLLKSYKIENGIIKIKKLNANQNLQNQNFLFYNIKKS